MGRAIESVLSQTRSADEIIIVDDGSDDDTELFIREQYPQLKYIKQNNSGVSAARNRGVRESSSHWLAFLDSDDEWLEKKLELQLASLEENPDYQLIHSEEVWIRNGVRVNQMNKHKKSGGEIFEKCLPMCVISPSSVLLSRQLFDRVGGFNEKLPACEDYDLWLKICSRYPVFYVEQPLIRKYGGHDDQLSRQHWGMDRFRIEALEDLLKGGHLDEQQSACVREMLLKKCNILLNGAEKRGNFELVRACKQLIENHQL